MKDLTIQPRTVYDPRGIIDIKPKPLADKIDERGVRLGVLDNSKWNAGKLLKATVGALEGTVRLNKVIFYKKETFSRNAAPELIEQMIEEVDAVLTAVGD